jgi:GT2 family glycosyltransferase
MMTLFSMIIPTCHRNEALVRLLAGVSPLHQEGLILFPGNAESQERECFDAYEVIVTDDGFLSTAEPIVREQFPWAKWVRGPKRGPAANRNQGAENAVGEWLVFVDDDCVPGPTLLAAYARAAAAGGNDVLEGMTIPDGDRDAADMECPINTSGGHLWSCNFAIKRRLFLELGGFDENFPGPAMEDIEMRTRLSKAGHQPAFVPEARVTHPWRARRGVQFSRLQAQSVVYYVNKHPEDRKWFSLTSIANRALGALLREFPRNLISYRGKGALRTLTLDLVFVSFLFRYFIRKIAPEKPLSQSK